MSTISHDERLARRVDDLTANDPQFAAARPDPAIASALEQPGLRLPQIMRTVLDGYAERPALGQRAVEFVKDPATGRTTLEILPRFETVTYRELGERVGALARALTDDPLQAGDRVCVLGFNSVGYATIDMALGQIGAVSVPLQTSAALTQLQPIVAETEPTVIAASVDQLPDAVELILSAPENAPARSSWCSTTTPRSTTSARPSKGARTPAARARLADAAVETLADVLERGKSLPRTPRAARGSPGG